MHTHLANVTLAMANFQYSLDICQIIPALEESVLAAENHFNIALWYFNQGLYEAVCLSHLETAMYLFTKLFGPLHGETQRVSKFMRRHADNIRNTIIVSTTLRNIGPAGQ